MKKRLLALVLCCAVVIGLVPAMVTAAYTDGTRLIVTCGDSSDSVVLQQGETADLTAIYEDFMEEGDTLQWQKSQEGDWVNIPGETGEHLYVTSDMLDGQTGFRCTITGPEGNVTESNCVYVELAAQDEVPQDESGTLFEDTAIELEDGETAEPAESVEPETDTTVDEPVDDSEPEDEPEYTDPSHTDICTDNCPGMDFCDCGCHLYDRLMSCDSIEELCDVMDSASEEQLEFITDEQWNDICAHAAELEDAENAETFEEDDNLEIESKIIYVTVDFTEVAPLDDSVVG